MDTMLAAERIGYFTVTDERTARHTESCWRRYCHEINHPYMVVHAHPNRAVKMEIDLAGQHFHTGWTPETLQTLWEELDPCGNAHVSLYADGCQCIVRGIHPDHLKTAAKAVLTTVDGLRVAPTCAWGVQLRFTRAWPPRRYFTQWETGRGNHKFGPREREMSTVPDSPNGRHATYTEAPSDSDSEWRGAPDAE